VGRCSSMRVRVLRWWRRWNRFDFDVGIDIIPILVGLGVAEIVIE
jgi:hypothetical protein